MKKFSFNKLTMLAAAALSISLAACHDDDNYSISKAELNLDRTAMGQLSATPTVTPFQLDTDADAEWTATVEWDEDENGQPAYVYPKKGVGPATLKIVTLDNLTTETRKGSLVITFPKDESKNITVPLTQQRATVVNGEIPLEGTIARGIGYGYNAFRGYCDANTPTLPILCMERMHDEDAISYDFSEVSIEQREESGASVEELARKLNTTAHASSSFCGFDGSVDASFNAGQKSTSSNEFAWMDVNVRSGRSRLNGAQEDIILEYMTDEAYNNINGIGKIVRGKMRNPTYPATAEGFRKMVMTYGTHLCIGGVLGGRIHTQAVCNTSKISTAYNASVALEASYSCAFASIEANATAKAQQASALSKNHSAFYFSATLRGGNQQDGSFDALLSVLNKMSKARQGAGTTDDLADDSETNVTISDDSEEYEMAGEQWMKGLTTSAGLSVEDVLANVALVDLNGDADLVPLYELIDRDLTEAEDGVNGEARYQAFKLWYETELMNDPEILKQRPNLSSYITIPPTKIDPMPTLTNPGTSESLIQDIYLTNGQHVARICSEFIPIINPSKRVNVIYPIVNGKARYNLGIFCGDEASYPAQVSWGWEQDPSTPVVTTMKGYDKGQRSVVYLRGNHLTLDPDDSFADSQYLTTSASPYTFTTRVDGKEVVYPLVKINDYIYMRNQWYGKTYNDGTEYWYPTDKDRENAGGWAHGVRTYTEYQQAHGGFTPTGWQIPYASQYQKMIDNLTEIEGSKPDGTVAASFMQGGVFGLNLGRFTYEGFYVTTNANQGDKGHYSIVNDDRYYLGCLDNADKTFWDGVTGEKQGAETEKLCPSFVINPNNGSVAIPYWSKDNRYGPEINKWNTGTWNWSRTPNDYFDYSNGGWPYPQNRRNYVFYPLILCQQAVK